MSTTVDNLIAFRILTMLVKPFDETDAFELGIIDKDGNNLIKTKHFTTSDQRDAYTYLHRLVFNLKKIINKLPGGESKLKNVVAALVLIKEAYVGQTYINIILEEYYMNILESIKMDNTLIEEMEVKQFFEDAPANHTGATVCTNEPVIKNRKELKSVVRRDKIPSFKEFVGKK